MIELKQSVVLKEGKTRLKIFGIEPRNSFEGRKRDLMLNLKIIKIVLEAFAPCNFESKLILKISLNNHLIDIDLGDVSVLSEFLPHVLSLFLYIILRFLDYWWRESSVLVGQLKISLPLVKKLIVR